MKKGKIYAVGIGPGSREHRTLRAVEAIKESTGIVGYKTYIPLIEDLIEDQQVHRLGMKHEVERCEKALSLALQGKTVSLISSGDAGIYAMAGILFEVIEKNNALGKVNIEVVSGVTASSAAAASLGAPIMHDHVSISLSDLLTPWSVIEKHLDLAGQGDFVISLYNPKSKGRPKHLQNATEILLRHRRKDTPVGIVINAKREGESVKITTLEALPTEEVNMFTMVLIGNSNTKILGDFLVTPRGYDL
ncbi:precorrin-3B C(17)-methyltransferase [Isachenkonia alkalipeptolytica]|uniref:Precorrin-3B C(17)-methyltransferase n=1 Tax=Isachenkonia alkalipeptolytica TaxID=2565777 RepID=A0AA44BDG7_9CLOT|nr:precorrin-3B C(17)-methyltransferase [Isachenkonia alkalipeptolytica]NBG87090.1 precorrin-3B C(17)-methyltransferase [Isachenkonia alkalipeptolytica]